VAPVLAGDNGAHRVDFFSITPVRGCDLVQPGTGTPTNSFAVINRNPAGNVVTAQVHLKDAQPNTTYTVGIWENDCSGGDFYQVRTNNQGSETRHLIGSISPETTISDVVLTARASGRSRFQAHPESDLRALRVTGSSVQRVVTPRLPRLPPPPRVHAAHAAIRVRS